MRMIYVHGIKQQGKSQEVIRRTWSAALLGGAVEAGEDTSTLETMTSATFAPFYGDRLFALSDSVNNWNAVAMGVDGEDDAFAEFASGIVREMALRAGADQSELEAEVEITPMGAGIHKKWLKAASIALERHAPFLAPHALKILGQAHAYLTRQHITDEVNAIVRPAFETEEPLVVVAHSLGTVVSYNLLRERAAKGLECPLFLTLGSPLGIGEVLKHFDLPRNVPKGVGRWVNAADPEDFVALHPRLGRPHFSDGIVNIDDVENGYDDPHDILRYLTDRRVREAICEAL